ncbi:arf-GAP with Rho-GAP domain, ANK repeat and PH domain-containing protein 1 [Siniperca chuatsi]|uniref:arf-GAP with Rho-GAP domain, ANK repeat and PH domain-containing protein 1 n=1 Tax=Siniperca chuatsi TaxID=119488 RepID=UPI001CE12CED|nr:arf-GAP with Rho-GAP domain, ANK repeat and PH domain-containing protein 1 [Siniperca chuatsi]XP_044078448.1 arf-GAP with Rho-GAP domain, ANK repeat and PH domain-containing protein 1 [Siniperca chuatsi]
MTPPLPLPVPKPRARYTRDSLSSASSLDRDLIGEDVQPLFSNGVHLSTDENAPPLPPLGGSDRGVVFPTLAGVTDIIATKIPSLAGFATSIGGSTPTTPAPPAPSDPPSIDSMTNSIAAHIPSLAGTGSVVANPAATTLNSASTTTPPPAANTGAASLDSIFSSLANIPSLAGIVSSVPYPAVSSMTTTDTPSAPPPFAHKPCPPSLPRIGDANTDVGALSQLVMSTLDQNGGVTLPPLEGAAQPTEDVIKQSPHTIREENPYITVLACWTSQEEADTDSSNEEEDTGVSPAPSGADGTTEGDSASNPSLNTNNLLSNPSGRLIPTRPAPPPPRPSGQSEKPLKQKTPRAATIRVSRKKGVSGSSTQQSAVVQSSWLDVWKGFRHNVLWATFDGQLMSLWKKRTDRFSELLFHVSSITNVKKQDKGRFSVYFRKKHYDFMAHSDDVREGWVTSLLASRGQPSPTPPELHGQIAIKDPRSRAYAAVWGHDLWIYPNKEGFQLGIASFSVPLNVATVKSTGKHSFTLITPYKNFNLSVDSSKDLSIWLDILSSSIRSALSCSQVALRLWENPDNKVCGDCGSANPEWASVNLLLVICQACAGQHRGLGSNLSKVRSLKMDNKVWTEPVIQLFVTYGNRLANQVWAPAVPAAEQLRPESSDEERSKFIQDKYSRGRYRRVHALTSSHSLMDQRLRQVVCGDDVEETMSLICSGAKVCQSDPQSPSPILLAERAGKALQTELLRLNEYTAIPPYLPQSANRRANSAPSGEEEEELHGKLEEDRFLFSLENDSAACDVLDLREVLSVFLKDGPAHEFEMVTLSDQLICAADNKEGLLTHLVHILKVILPGGVSYAEVGGASAVSKVFVIEVGGASSYSDAWLLLWEDGVSVHPIQRHTEQTLRMELGALSRHEMDPSENIITMVTADRSVSLRFEEQHSCQSWFNHLQRALTNQRAAPQRPPAASHSSARQSLYPVMDVGSTGSVPPAIERCISHITTYGLKVEGVYRRCGLAVKVTRLVEALMTSPSSAPLESDEQGVLDAGSALKQYVRQQESLIPDRVRQQWLQAAVISDERSRFSAYRRLLRQLPDDNRATLNALFGHFYMVQVLSQVNRMSAQNLALVLVPTLFQTLNQDLLRLTREFIIHHTLLFLTPEVKERAEEEEQITVF